MVPRCRPVLALLFLLSPLSARVPTAPAAPLPRALLLTHSAGYAHGVVTRPAPDELSLVEAALVAATRGRYALAVTQDCAQLNAAALDELDLVIFFTSGELPLAPGTVPALLDWVAGGGAFVAIHSATDTLYEQPAYLQMVGGTFDGHPWQQQLTLRVETRRHPATAHLGASWTLTDEIYQFRDQPTEPLAVLLSLTGEGGLDLGRARQPDARHPIAWCRPYGRGRVFTTALGHRAELWSDPAFLEHLLGGMDWAVGGPDQGVRPLPTGPGVVDLSRTEAWTHRGGGRCAWERRGETLVATPGAGDLVSREAFGDALIHVEFAVPPGGNSGVYVQGRYEVQIYETFGQPLVPNSCGALYGVAAPARDAMRAPERWQSFDIRFRAPRFDEAGERLAPARISIWHNGLVVHQELALPGPTPGGLGDNEVARGPLMLQDHGSAVRFTDVWVVPLPE